MFGIKLLSDGLSGGIAGLLTKKFSPVVPVAKAVGSAANNARKDITKAGAAGLLDITEAGLKPIGLEKYAAPIAGAGVALATGNPYLGAAVAGGVKPASEGQLTNAAKGAATGAALAGVGNVLAPAVSNAVGGGLTGNVAGSAAAGGTSAALTGGDVRQGLLGGGIGAVFNYGVNSLLGVAPGSVGGIDDSNYDLGKSMALQDFYYLNNISPQNRMGPVSRATTDKVLGLLGGSLLAGGAGALANRFVNTKPATQQMAVPARPVQQFKLSPTVNRYDGDFASYGERGSGGFRFYNAPLGLLG